MPSLHPDERTGRLEGWLLSAVLLFYAIGLPLCGAVFRPGYGAYDEESTLDQIQAWREGGPLDVRFARSSVHRLFSALLVRVGGPHLFLLHLPALLAVLAEAVLLYVWLRSKLGERAALWAVLADLVCTATFARGDSLLGSCMLPCAFLLGAVCCEGLRRPWQAALWGLAAGLMLLDYEGWVGALLFLLPYAFWRWKGGPGLRLAGGLGFIAGLAVLVHLNPALGAVLKTRHSLSSPDAGWFSQAWANTRGLLSNGDRLAFAAATGHPWPPPWIWPLALCGAAGALIRFPWLAWLLLVGGAALGLAHTAEEPQRLSLALLALGAFSGAGVSLLWRRPWGRALCLALLLFGAADEIHAWVSVPPQWRERAYGESTNLEEAADWLAQNGAPGGWDVISGLGPREDGAFRFLLDQAGVRPGGKTPIALIDWDYGPGLKSLRKVVGARSFGSYHPVLLLEPGPADAARLRRVSASLLPLRSVHMTEPPLVIVARAAAWLQAPENADPWARTVAWEIWLHSSLLTRSVDMGGVRQMLSEPMVCAWAPDVLAKELQAGDPALALRFREKAEAIDPQRRAMSQDERISRY